MRIMEPSMSTNHQKRGLSVSQDIFFDTLLPINIPMMARPAICKRSIQSIESRCSPLVNPMREFSAIIKSDVPMASFIGILLNITSAGIIINPPPAPTNPVIVPTTIPSNMIQMICFFLQVFLSFSGRIMESEAAIISTAKNPSKNISFEIEICQMSISAGILGMTHIRVKNTAITAGIPNTITCIGFTSFCRVYFIPPTRLVIQTMKRE